MNTKKNERGNFMVPNTSVSNGLKKREEFAVNLRKKKTMARLQQKRRKIAEVMSQNKENRNLNQNDVKEEIQNQLRTYAGYPPWKQQDYVPVMEILEQIFGTLGQNFEQFVQNTEVLDKISSLLKILEIDQLNEIQQLAVLTSIRQELSRSDAVEVREISLLVNSTDIIPTIMAALSSELTSETMRYIKLEASWILSNIAYGDHLDLQSLFNPADFSVPIITKILTNTKNLDLQLIDQIMFFLGNMTGSSQFIFDMIKQTFDLPKIVINIIKTNKAQNNPPIEKCFIKNYLWIGHNISRYGKSLRIDEVQNLCELFITNIKDFKENEEDEGGLIDILEGLAFLSATGNEEILSLVTGAGLFPQGGDTVSIMAELLGSKHDQVYKSCLKYVGGILGSENMDITNRLLDTNAIEKITNIMYSAKNDDVKKALWCLSNFTATKDPNYQASFVESYAANRVTALARSHNINVQQEALWVLTNCITMGSDDHARQLLLKEHGDLVKVLVKGLKLPCSDLVNNIICSILKLLQTDKKLNVVGQKDSVFEFMEECDAQIYIEGATSHPDERISETANEVYELFDFYHNQFDENEFILDFDRPAFPQNQNMKFEEPNNDNGKHLFSI